MLDVRAWPRIVCVLLIGALLGPGVSAAPPGEPNRPVPVDAPKTSFLGGPESDLAAWKNHRVGDPLALLDRRALFEQAAELGSMAQAVNSSVAPIVREAEYVLIPMGDANQDGKIDLLLSTVVRAEDPDEDEDVETLELLSGSDRKTIWTKKPPEDSYWFTLEDLTNDGVRELVFASGSSEGSGQARSVGPASASRYESYYDGKYEILSGADLSPVSTVMCRENNFSTSARVTAPAGGMRVSYSDWTFGFCFLQARVGQLWTVVFEHQASFANAGSFQFASVGLTPSTDSVTVRSLEPSGKVRWTTQARQHFGGLNAVLWSDMTGDGQDDIVFVASSAPVGYAAAPNAWADIENPQPPRAWFVDGMTGATLWTREFPLASSFAWVTEGALLGASKRALLVQHGGSDPARGGELRVIVDQVDPVSGAQLRSKTFINQLVQAAPVGDADKDGKGDYFLAVGDVKPDAQGHYAYPSKFKIGVTSQEFAYLWGPLALDGDAFGVPAGVDLTGDGVMEIVSEVWGGQGDARLDMIDGATGRLLWTHKLDDSIVSLGPLGDLDGDGGSDLGLVVFEVPPPAPLPSSTSEPGQTGSPGVPPVPRPPFEDTFDYAKYPGFLEVRRGSDKELIWRKQIHEPSQRLNVQADWVIAYATTIADLNGNGVPDVVLNVDSPFLMMMACTPSGCQSEAPTASPLSLALVLDGADGATLWAYPPHIGASAAIVGKAGVVPRPQALPSEPGTIPALPGLAALLGLVGWAALRRRYA